MVNVIGVRFQNAGKLYFFDPGPYWPTPGDFVIVETARGIEFGEVVTGIREMDDEQLAAPLKKVVRVATAEDVQHAKDNKAAEKEAYAICQQKIADHRLDMKLVSVEYTFDNSKILFYFTANGRVDFRSLVKDLAFVFRTRIELRQIGVRDEAKMLGGLGPCGRPICCGAFLGDFQPVSIKMAKEQNLSLNPNKISGVCGRLMCCLKYEQDNYEQTRKRMPKVGKEVITPDGPGVVWDLNIIKETVRVRIQKGDSSELRDYPLEDVQRPGMAAKPRQEAPQDAEEEIDAPDMAEEELMAEEAEPEEADEAPMPEATEEEEQEQEARKRPRGRGHEGRQRPPKRGGEGKLGAPVRRENPNRRQEQQEAPAEQPVRQLQNAPRQAEATHAQTPVKGPQNASGAAPGQESAPAQTPVRAPQKAPAEASASAPANPWKAALERAMRAAQSGDE